MAGDDRAFDARDQWVHEVGLDGAGDPGAAAPVALRSASSGERLEWQLQSRAVGSQGGDAELSWRAPRGSIQSVVRAGAPEDLPVAIWTPSLLNPTDSTTEVYEDWHSLDTVFAAEGLPRVWPATAQ